MVNCHLMQLPFFFFYNFCTVTFAMWMFFHKSIGVISHWNRAWKFRQLQFIILPDIWEDIFFDPHMAESSKEFTIFSTSSKVTPSLITLDSVLLHITSMSDEASVPFRESVFTWSICAFLSTLTSVMTTSLLFMALSPLHSSSLQDGCLWSVSSPMLLVEDGVLLQVGPA